MAGLCSRNLWKRTEAASQDFSLADAHVDADCLSALEQHAPGPAQCPTSPMDHNNCPDEVPASNPGAALENSAGMPVVGRADLPVEGAAQRLGGPERRQQPRACDDCDTDRRVDGGDRGSQGQWEADESPSWVTPFGTQLPSSYHLHRNSSPKPSTCGDASPLLCQHEATSPERKGQRSCSPSIATSQTSARSKSIPQTPISGVVAGRTTEVIPAPDVMVGAEVVCDGSIETQTSEGCEASLLGSQPADCDEVDEFRPQDPTVSDSCLLQPGQAQTPPSTREWPALSAVACRAITFFGRLHVMADHGQHTDEDARNPPEARGLPVLSAGPDNCRPSMLHTASAGLGEKLCLHAACGSLQFFHIFNMLCMPFGNQLTCTEVKANAAMRWPGSLPVAGTQNYINCKYFDT